MQRLAAFAGMYKTGSSRPRRKMSAAARARISAAQKARWAKAKGQKVVPIKAGKRRISAASRTETAITDAFAKSSVRGNQRGCNGMYSECDPILHSNLAHQLGNVR